MIQVEKETCTIIIYM